MSAAVQRIAAQVPFCLVSARSPEGLYPIQRALGFSGPLACFSGAYVLDHEGNELLSHVIPTADAVKIKQHLARHYPKLTVGTYGFHTWIVDDRSDPRVQREEWYVQASSEECRDVEAAFGLRGVHKFLLMGEPEQVLQAEQTLSAMYPELNVVRSNETLCEVMSKQASKRRAVELLCSHYGASREGAVAFGDGPNDRDMLEAVDNSYAMTNAEDVVKRAAAYVLPWSNEECGVTRQLELLGL
jgi:Cof subfamily protein (haloacid dehalogenase superfamily)